VVVINRSGEIVGYTAGNDMSSRTIEGENPLYLPQAKIFDGACAVGPAIRLLEDPDELVDIKISIRVTRDGALVMSGTSEIRQMNRPIADLVGYLRRELALPHGAFLMTGTGIIPAPEFTLARGDEIEIVVGELTLTNHVAD
jgi:2-dehydro-3-deoxy-D-arabinonate dehydratase